MTSDTYHVYSAHPYLHLAVGIPDALVLLVDEASCSLYDLPGTVTACLNAGLHMFGELLREGVVSRLRLRRRHKKALRRTLQRWLHKRGGKIMRQPTKAESKTLLRLAADNTYTLEQSSGNSVARENQVEVVLSPGRYVAIPTTTGCKVRATAPLRLPPRAFRLAPSASRACTRRRAPC